MGRVLDVVIDLPGCQEPPGYLVTGKHVYDQELYKARHLIENFFRRLKQYRAIATRYDQTARNFLAAVYLAAAVVWLN